MTGRIGVGVAALDRTLPRHRIAHGHGTQVQTCRGARLVLTPFYC
jgi:hypothetical protein